MELVRKQVEALNRSDLDGVMSNVAQDMVLDGRVDSFEGRAAIRGFLEDWFRTWEEWDLELEEVSDLGNGVTFSVYLSKGRPVGSTGYVPFRYAVVSVWADAKIKRVTTHTDIDQARTAAERLAQERARADV